MWSQQYDCIYCAYNAYLLVNIVEPWDVLQTVFLTCTSWLMGSKKVFPSFAEPVLELAPCYKASLLP